MRGAMEKSATCRACGRDFAPHRRAGLHVYCKRCTAKADKEIARKISVDCKECGKTFPTKTRSVRYCSDACRAAAARRTNAENQRKYLADPEKHALKLARARVCAANKRARDRGERPPPPPRAGRGAGSQGRNAKAAEPYLCALCGRDFAPYGDGARPAHCKRCRAKADREIGRAWTLNCKECGKEFSTSNRIVRYCSTKCNAAGHARNVAESARRRMANPEARALEAARWRARAAARKAAEKGGRQRSA